jgi:hypothetical protein
VNPTYTDRRPDAKLPNSNLKLEWPPARSMRGPEAAGGHLHSLVRPRLKQRATSDGTHRASEGFGTGLLRWSASWKAARSFATRYFSGMTFREPRSVEAMAALFRELKARRYGRTVAGARDRRALTPAQREAVLAKTDGACHGCGGIIGGDWHADHVSAHSTGGRGHGANLLAAHAVCNGYKKRFLPEEMIYVLKLGIWAKTEIERQSSTGRAIGAAFITHEASRRRRTRKPSGPAA